MSSFPASTYSRYKRATSFFLDWLLRARGRGRHADKRVRLETLSTVVKEVVASPSILTPKLLQQLPKALAACQCAITLREHVAAFFADADDGHAHFLGLLKSWHRELMGLEVEPDEEREGHTQDAAADKLKFENYYQVLQVDENFFPAEEGEDLVVEQDTPKRTKVDRQRLFEEAFADELKMELVYFFMELDELMEGVCNVYNAVKWGQRSLVEATVVATLAIDIANTLTTQVQLKYPSLDTAEQMFNIVRNIAPEKFRLQMVEICEEFMADLKDRLVTRVDGLPYVSGIFLADFVPVGSTLLGFGSALPDDRTRRVVLQRDAVGEMYGEDRTPHYPALPNGSNVNPLLLQQLILLYNTLVDLRVAGYKPTRPMEAFLTTMNDYFTSGVVTVPVVFTCLCWMKSVAALQGHLGLSRNMSLAIRHSRELMQQANATLEKGAVFKPTDVLLNRCKLKIMQDEQFHHLARANPLYAGQTMLDHHFEYIGLASDILVLTSRFRAFGHLYNALVNEGYLERIPFFDDVLDIYDEMIFAPSRDAAKPGAYHRTYLLSGHLRATSLDAVYSGKDFPSGKEGYVKRKQLRLKDVSQTYRLMMLNDKSCLGGESWTDMLDSVANICSEEMFDTRVLSRDLLRLNDDLVDLFNEMCDELDQRDYYEEIVACPRPGESREQRLNAALEESIMQFVMPFFDALLPDGSIDMSAIPGEYPANATMNPNVVRGMCEKAAAVIESKFVTSSLSCEEKYFTFPAEPDFITQEFGTDLVSQAKSEEKDEDVFKFLMAMLQVIEGPLPDGSLNYLKEEIKLNPGLLTKAIGPDPDTHIQEDMCTLFHWAAAGPAHDADLVEWMIQMGALMLQPMVYCRKEPQQKELHVPRNQLPNTMALHNAAIAGYDDIVRIILEADNLVDLNTSTYQTKETPAHLAVKHGHRNVYEVLRAFGADFGIRDGKGRRVCDVTTDCTWSRKIAEAAEHEEIRRTRETPTAARLRKTLSARREQRLHSKQGDVTSDTSNETKKMSTKSKKKHKKKGKPARKMDGGDSDAAVKETIIAEASTPMENVSATESSLYLKQLLQAIGVDVDESADPGAVAQLKVSLLKLTTAIFTRLRDPKIPVSEKADDVHNASQFIKSVTGSMESFSSETAAFRARDTLLTLFSQAAQLIHMMQKMHRVDHAAITVPALAPVQDLCDTNWSFAQFVVRTARIGVSTGRKTQAQELLDLLEKRLLKMSFAQRRSSDYRGLAQMYSTAREELGFGKTSTATAYRTLEWYIADPLENYKLQKVFDGMDGCPFYFDLVTTAAEAFEQLERAIDDDSALSGVACFGDHVKHVVYGGATKNDVESLRGQLYRVAEEAGVHFSDRTSQPCTAAVRVGEFVFSGAGIVRDSATS